MRAIDFFWLGAALVSNLALNAQGQATPGSPQTNAPTLIAEVRHEAGPGLMPAERAYVSLGANYYAFLAPEGLRLDNSQHGKVVLRNEDYSTFIVFRIAGSMADGADEISSESAREMLLSDQPGARISDEFSRYAGGHSGPAFDLNWLGKGGLPQVARAVFIPCRDKIIEFKVVSTKGQFGAAQRQLQTVLLTFRASNAPGELDVPRTSDRI